MAENEPTSTELLTLTTQIVAAHVRRNSVSPSDVPGFIRSVHEAFAEAGQPIPEEPKQVPAVSIKKSVQPDYIVCLEDGKKLKMLKRHLMTAFGMTPEQYREKWGLSSDYPMVAPNYAEQRSKLAKKIGLGKDRTQEVGAPKNETKGTTKRKKKTAA